MVCFQRLPNPGNDRARLLLTSKQSLNSARRVSYAMLLNEFLKEHRKVQEQEATIAQLQSRMDALVAHVEQQDSKIERVSDQVEMSKAAPQVAAIK